MQTTKSKESFVRLPDKKSKGYSGIGSLEDGKRLGNTLMLIKEKLNFTSESQVAQKENQILGSILKPDQIKFKTSYLGEKIAHGSLLGVEEWRFLRSVRNFVDTSSGTFLAESTKTYELYSFNNKNVSLAQTKDYLKHAAVHLATGIASTFLLDSNIIGYDQTMNYLFNLTGDETFKQHIETSSGAKRLVTRDMKNRFVDKHVGTHSYFQQASSYIDTLIVSELKQRKLFTGGSEISTKDSFINSLINQKRSPRTADSGTRDKNMIISTGGGGLLGSQELIRALTGQTSPRSGGVDGERLIQVGLKHFEKLFSQESTSKFDLLCKLFNFIHKILKFPVKVMQATSDSPFRAKQSPFIFDCQSELGIQQKFIILISDCDTHCVINFGLPNIKEKVRAAGKPLKNNLNSVSRFPSDKQTGPNLIKSKQLVNCLNQRQKQKSPDPHSSINDLGEFVKIEHGFSTLSSQVDKVQDLKVFLNKTNQTKLVQKSPIKNQLLGGNGTYPNTKLGCMIELLDTKNSERGKEPKKQTVPFKNPKKNLLDIQSQWKNGTLISKYVRLSNLATERLYR